MLPQVVPVFWITLASTFAITCLFLPVEGQAQQLFDTNPDHYVFGWFTTALLEPGQLPICKYCINALGDGMLPVDTVNGPDWNRTVGLYRCDGAQNNEIWAYNSSTKSIAYANFKHNLCLDAVLLDSNYTLKLLSCNLSVVTQQWNYENNTLVNGLFDSTTGQNYTMWALPPDVGTYPSDNNYTYPLTIASSAPPATTPGFSYTSSFTFLPIANLAQRFTGQFTTKGLLQISNSSLGQIANGDFENSTILAGTEINPSAWNQTFPSYFALCGWVIDYGPIDYVNAGYLPAASGYRSIHLNTFTDVSHSGSISQTIRTEKDKEYILSFFMNARPNILDDLGRPPCSPSYVEAGARLQLRVTNYANTTGLPSNGTDFTQNFTSNVTGSNTHNLGAWKQETVNFTALTNLTKISFISLNVNDSCGPMIDMVEVSLKRERKNEVVLGVVAGTVGGLAGVIAILSIGYRVRLYRARVDYSGLYKTEHAKVYTVKELSIATKNFSSVLGEGGFGTVYKAEFLNGTVGAVKVEKPKGPNSSSKVLASEEIAVLLRVHHINLVNLTGFCIHNGRQMLVFEYLPNGSLHDRLHRSILHRPPAKSSNSIELSPVCSDVLSWKQRVKIAADVARGLEYLHFEANPPIVHRDIKSQNILLTTRDCAKLADFGLSKAAPEDATSFESVETIVKGSIGYLDPQYLTTGVFSPKSDVYSFGVVLLELISGHPAVYNANSLASWAAEYMTSPYLYHYLVDEKLDGDFNATELESLIELSKQCMRMDGKMRPNMQHVGTLLNSRQFPSLGDEISEGMEEFQIEAHSTESFHKMNELLIDYEPHTQGSSSSRWFAQMLKS